MVYLDPIHLVHNTFVVVLRSVIPVQYLLTPLLIQMTNHAVLRLPKPKVPHRRVKFQISSVSIASTKRSKIVTFPGQQIAIAQPPFQTATRSHIESNSCAV